MPRKAPTDARYKVKLSKDYRDGHLVLRARDEHIVSQALYDKIKDQCATAEPVK